MKKLERAIRNKKGFLLIELLISGIILASCIAAAMYLFKIGYQNLGRADKIYLFYSKLPTAVNYIKYLPEKEGVLELGDGINMIWKSEPIVKGLAMGQKESKEVPFKINLYKVTLILKSSEEEKRFTIMVFKYEQ